MAKVFDYISLTAITFLLTFVWTALLFDSALPALILSCALTLIIAVTVRYVKGRFGKPYTYDRLGFEFAVRGNAYIISLMKSVVKNPDVESGENYILLSNSIVIAAYRYSQLGVSDIGAICREATAHGRKLAFVICRTIERRAYAAAQVYGVKIVPVKTKTVYNILKKHGALPPLKETKEKITLKGLLAVILSRANFKSYAFSGTTLILVSFLTPLKIYYLTFGSISLALALATLTPLGNGNFSSIKLQNEFENAVSSKPNQISIDELDLDDEKPNK